VAATTSTVAPGGKYQLSIDMIYHISSKLLGWVSAPETILLLVLLVGAALLWTRWHGMARIVVSVATGGFVVIAVLPIGYWLMVPLEARFQAPSVLPDVVDGIIVLGGSSKLRTSIARDQVVLNDNSERLTSFATLALRYPKARLVFSGGSGSLRAGPNREADIAFRFFGEIGLDPSRILLEREARNTFENAENSFDLVKPSTAENWLLVTSARHMPRAMGAFRKAGWNIIPYPVDYRTSDGEFSFEIRWKLHAGITSLRNALHEWIGMVVYRALDRSDELFPGPQGP
jgi:uncharacterized SAM-binding protein YcdF (DUF218 family)